MIRFAQSHSQPAQQWHHIRLDAPQLIEREHERMKLLFSSTYMAAYMPRGMNLWMAPGGDGGADIYMSPQSVPFGGELIRRYEARACEPPSQPVVLIAGHHYGTGRNERGTLRPIHVPQTDRNYAPARYACRSLRDLAGSRIATTWPYAKSRLAPFVRRFAQAWDLLPPRPRPQKEGA